MISQQTVCGEIGRPNKDQVFPDIAKKIPRTSNNDIEIDENQSKERCTKIEQTRTFEQSKGSLFQSNLITKKTNGTYKTLCKEEGRKDATRGTQKRTKRIKRGKREKDVKIWTGN